MSAPARPHTPANAFRSTRQVLAILAGLLLVASAAVAGVLITYNTGSTSTLALKGPPVVWGAGADASSTGFVPSWALSSNRTYFTVTLNSVPEANVTWSNLTTLTNQDTAAWTVQVDGPDLSAYSHLTTFRLEFYNPSGTVGALNLTAGQTSVNLGSMAAGASLSVRVYAQLAGGTGLQDLPPAIHLSVTLS